MKTYYSATGFRSLDNVVYVREDGVTRPLEHHVRHSPDGFSWGYGGSGPAELARCILWDLLGEEPRPSMYQDFKWHFIATLPQDEGWELTSKDIEAWLDQKVWV